MSKKKRGEKKRKRERRVKQIRGGAGLRNIRERKK